MQFTLRGALDCLELESGPACCRADSLWRHTCFETFFHTGAGGYIEANVTARGAWNLYRFSGYRHGMREVFSVRPKVTFARADNQATLTASWSAIPRGTLIKPAMILAERDTRHYFAPEHGVGAPDFHSATGLWSWETT